MGIEQAGYPYIEGVRGIPFSEMEDSIQLYESPSGRRLQIILMPEFVDVSDVEDENYYMQASVNYGTLETRLATRDFEDMNKPPHPDMEGRKFIDFCLNFFENGGVEIRKWRESWGNGSINFAEYKKAKDATGSTSEAVRST